MRLSKVVTLTETVSITSYWVGFIFASVLLAMLAAADSKVYAQVVPSQSNSLMVTPDFMHATLTWQTPDDSYRDEITGFEYRFREASKKSFSNWIPIPGGAGIRSIDVQNLEQQTRYVFQVSAKNLVGDRNTVAEASAITRSSDAFITTWRIPANDLTITFPGKGNYIIDWGDSSPAETATSAITHTYAMAGDYVITASNGITRFFLNRYADAKHLIELSQWGNAVWTTMEGAFYGATNMQLTATDAPDLSQVTDMSLMFCRASSFNSDLNHWDVSRVTNMQGTFFKATVFNSDISGWDVSQVTNMQGTFAKTNAFNSDISGWNVSRMRDTSAMFNDARHFNQDISGWDVTQVMNMSGMFIGADVFNQNLGKWYIVPRASASYDGSDNLVVLNIQAQNTYLDHHNLSYTLTPGDVDNAEFTLRNNLLSINTAQSGVFNIRIAAASAFGTQNTRQLRLQIIGTSIKIDDEIPATAPEAPKALSASQLGGEVTLAWAAPNDGGAPITGYEYRQTQTAGTYLSSWTTTNADTSHALNGLSPGTHYFQVRALNQVGDSQPSNEAFAYLPSTTDFVTRWRIPDDDLSISFPGEGQYIIDWGDGQAELATGRAEHTYAMAGDYVITASNGITRFFLNRYADAKHLIELSQWGNAVWTTMEGAFYGATNMQLTATDAPDLSQVTDMSLMFCRARSFNSDLNHWDVSQVTNMQGTFAVARVFNSDLSGWDVSRVTNMYGTFKDAFAFNSDISGWDVSQVRGMLAMFHNARRFNQDISGWDVSRVEVMSNMFIGADVFNQNLGKWYIVPKASTSYDGNDNLVVLSIAAQNLYLHYQKPRYTLTPGDVDNAAFTLRNNLLSINTAQSGVFNIRIAVASAFGIQNTRQLRLQIIGKSVKIDDEIPATAPEAPKALSASQLGGEVTLAWAAPNDGGVPITGYEYRHTQTAGTYLSSWTTTNAGTSHALNGLSPGTHYFQVRALNQVGDSQPSNEAFAYLPSTTDFVTRWRIPDDDLSISFPGEGQYIIDWGDGQAELATGRAEHTYAAAGDYVITASNGITRFFLNRYADAKHLIELSQWGNAVWTTMESAFLGATNMQLTATDAPDLSQVTDMNLMFSGARSFNSALNHWDVSRVIHMTSAFFGAVTFNGELNGWDVSQVTDMHEMFHGATDFNSDLSGWDVSQVRDMSSMFHKARRFNQDISGWDVTQVINMSRIFHGADSFNQNLSRWYIVPKVSTSYDGSDNLVVLTFGTQFQLLEPLDLSYTLTDGAGDADNTKFTINGTELSIKAHERAIFNLRIGVSAPEILPATNSTRQLRVQVVGTNIRWGDEIQITVPDAPRDLSATPAETSVTLTWVAPAYNGGAPISDYVVTYDDGSGVMTFDDGISLATSLTLPNLIAGEAYTFTLAAVNDIGAGAVATLSAKTLLHNTAPIANAGSDQIVESDEKVTLEGGGSTDDSIVTAYLWTQQDCETATLSIKIGTETCPTVTLRNPNTLTATFVAPSLELDASNLVLVFNLTVTDDDGVTSEPARVSITITPPVLLVIGEAEVNYAEHARNPVATYSISTIGNINIVRWELGGADEAVFSFNAETGELAFNSSPDFESPTDVDMDNAYEVALTVIATTAMGHDLASEAFSTMVTVTDLDEPGTVTIVGTAQVGQALTASLTDSDNILEDSVTWQWNRQPANANSDNARVDIRNATAATYTLVNADSGKQLRVVATYTDGHGPNKTVTSEPTIEVVRGNVPPAPGVALNADTGTFNNDGITNNPQVDLTLVDSAIWEYSTDFGDTFITGTDSSFDLSDGTYDAGQVQVRQTLNDLTSVPASLGEVLLDRSRPTLVSITSNSMDGIYKEGAEINLKVTLSKAVSDQNILAQIALGTSAQAPLSESFSLNRDAAEQKVFNGVLHVIAGHNSPDLRVASLSGDGTAPTDVAGNEVDFTLPEGANLDDNHNIVIDTTLPEVKTFADITHALLNEQNTTNIAFSEPVTGLEISDFNTSRVTLDSVTPSDAISDMTYTITYTPSAALFSMTLKAYSVMDHADNTGPTAAVSVHGTADEGLFVLTATVMSSGMPGYAKEGDLLSLSITLSEAITADPNIVIAGQLATVAANGNDYTATYQVVAEDVTAGAVTYDIGTMTAAGNAKDMLDPAPVTTNIILDITAPEVTLPDLVPGVVGVPQSIAFTFSEAVTGLETTDFIATGATFNSLADSGATSDMIYTLNYTPTASNVALELAANTVLDVAGNTGPSMAASAQSTMANTPPAIMGNTRVAYSENDTAVIAIYRVTDTDGDTLSWTLGSADLAFFSFDIDSGELSFNSPPDFENPSDIDMDNSYEVSITVTDGGIPSATSTLETLVLVTNVDDPGRVTIAGTAMVGQELSASLADEDRDELASSVTWSWMNVEDGSTVGTDAPSYIPVPSDVGDTLTVTATYDDSTGIGRTASATSAAVVAAPAPEAPIIALAEDTGTATADGITSNRQVKVTLATDFDTALDITGGDTWEFSTDGANFIMGTGTSFDLNDGVYDAGDVQVRQTVNGTESAVASLGPVTIDTTAPVITLNGADTLVVEFGGRYTDAGTTVTDAEAGLVATATGTVDPHIAGPYTITYGVTDTAGNVAEEVTRRVAVAEPRSADATLSGLAISHGSLIPTFASDIKTYTATVAHNVAGVTVTPVTTDANASVTVNTVAVTSGAASGMLDLTLDADTSIAIRVTAEDGITIETYHLTVTRAANTAPTISGDDGVLYAEHDTALVATYTVDDTENNAIIWSVTGTDALLFAMDAANGQLTFKNPPNFEDPQDDGQDNIYELTIIATETNGNPSNLASELEVGVSIINQDDPGRVTIAGTAMVGETLTASLTDPDMLSVGPLTWEWMNVEDGSIVGTGASSYIPVPSDVGDTLTVTATYDDSTVTNRILSLASVTVVRTASATSAAVVAAPAPEAPIIALAEDTGTATADGITSNRQVKVTLATDFDTALDITGGDTWEFSTDGANFIMGTGTSFDLNDGVYDAGDVQVRQTVNGTESAVASLGPVTIDTTAPVIALNGADTLVVEFGGRYTDAGTTVTDAEAGLVATATGTVDPHIAGPYTITYGVTDTAGNVAEEVTRRVAVAEPRSADATLSGLAISHGSLIPTFASDIKTYTATVAHNVAGITVTPVTTDANASVTVNTVAVTSGAASGMLDLTLDADTSIAIRVTAEDGITIETYHLTVTRAANTAPTISGDDGVLYAEHDTALVATYTADDTEGNAITFGVSGLDAPLFAMDAANGQLTFKNPPDFEDPQDDGQDNIYELTITATETNGNPSNLASELEVGVSIINQDDPGRVTIAGTAMVGETLTASLTDPDMLSVGPLTWEWMNVEDGSTVGTDAPSYIPVPSDVGDTLTVTATYDDSTVTNRILSLASVTVVRTASATSAAVAAAPAPEAPIIALAEDTGTATADGITSNRQVKVTLATDFDTALDITGGDTWEFSTDGANFIMGTGTSFDLNDGVYDAGDVQVRQTVNGTESAVSSLGPVTIDTTAPVIALNGADTLVVEFGGRYTDAGTTVTDAEAGLVATATGTVDSHIAGPYTITYGVTDTAGNVAEEVTRRVAVAEPITATILALSKSTVGMPASVKATFNVAVTGMTTSDFTPTNANMTEMTGSGKDYIVTYTPIAPGKVTLSMYINGRVGEVFATGTATMPAAESEDRPRFTAIVTVLGITTAEFDEDAFRQGIAGLSGAGAIADDVRVLTISAGSLVVKFEVVTDDVSVRDTQVTAYEVAMEDPVQMLTAAAQGAEATAATSTAPELHDGLTDIILPVIELLGDNPMILGVGDTYTDPGATAMDNVDGVLTTSIVVDTSNLDTETPGSYTVTYIVTDAASNTATAIRSVSVADLTPPVITLLGDNPMILGVGDTYTDPGATAMDNVDGVLTTSIVVDTSNLDTETPGIYVVTYTLIDVAGNGVEVTRSVQILGLHDYAALNRVVLSEVARALVDENVSAITQRIEQARLLRSASGSAGGDSRSVSLSGVSNLADIIKSQGRTIADDQFDFKRLLAASDFVLPLSGVGTNGKDPDGTGYKTLIFWGAGSYRSLDGSDDIRWNGDLFSLQLGLDTRLNEHTIAGVSVSKNQVELNYSNYTAAPTANTSGRSVGKGDYDLSITSIHPYIGWTSGSLDFWATLGYGSGDLELTDKAAPQSGNLSSDLNLQTLALGGSGVVMQTGKTTLRLKAEAMQTQLEVEASTQLAALEVDARRLRMTLEATRAQALDSEAQFESSLEAGVRHDGGDGETGSGAEVGGTLRYASPNGSFTMQGRARVLVSSKGDTEEWGLSGVISLRPSIRHSREGGNGPGLSFSVTPSYGVTASGVQRVWQEGLIDEGRAGSSKEYSPNLDIRLDYGMHAPGGPGLMTPYIELSLGDGGNTYRLGLQWQYNKMFDLKLVTERKERLNTTENSILLKADIRF